MLILCKVTFVVLGFTSSGVKSINESYDIGCKCNQAVPGNWGNSTSLVLESRELV